MSTKRKIMVVDDEEDIALLIRHKFRNQIRNDEYEFIFAKNGIEALQKLQEHPDLDMVFSDINMPEMDGLTLLRKVKFINPLLRTVMISAYSDMANIRQAMNGGAFDFIGKPLDFEDFELTLEKTLQFVEHFKNSHQAIEENSLLNLRTQELAKKNEEIELLLKEVHHRVKNNLQTISSMLNLQSATITDETALRAVRESQDRVRSMSLIHQKLYQGKNIATVEMKDYLMELSRTLLYSFGAENGRVKLAFPMSELELDVDTAIPLGLISNELITNTLKYAFPAGRSGSIEISLNQENEQLFCLRIADDGVGMPEGVNVLAPGGTGFGSRLVQLLAIQLNGKVELRTNKGVETLVWFEPSGG
jgi:two-component sensor histidine kinase